MPRNSTASLLAAGGTLLLLLLLGAAPPSASAFSPKVRHQGREWAPARPTGLAATPAVSLAGAGDVSPAPTEAPRHPNFGGVDLFRRDFTKGTDTCGFAAQYKSEPWTCFRVGASCVSFSTVMGCCAGVEPDCYSSLLTSCRNYVSGTSSASCAPGTLCCPSSSPSCFTWQYSTTNTAGVPGNTYSIFNCYASGGTGTLLSTPPALRLSSSGSGSGSIGAKTEPTALNPPDPTNTDPGAAPTPTPQNPSSSGSSSSSNNTGAIVGGAVGGVAVLAAVGVAIAWLVMRNRREKAAAAAAAAAASGGSGAGGGGGGFPNQAYSPGQSAVSPVSMPVSPSMGQNGYFAVPQQQPAGPDGRYPSYYDAGKPQLSPVYGDAHHQHAAGAQWHAPPPQGATELPNTTAVGSTGNRAELV